MSIKILGGLAKGRSLFVLNSAHLRPTSVMLRRKIFDSRQNLEGWIFVDLCAGSGAVGLEALSRGAQQVFLIESHPKAFGILKKNCKIVQDAGIAGDFDAIKLDALRFLDGFENIYLNFDKQMQERTILFFDPPYLKHALYKTFVEFILKKTWFKGEVWLESDTQKGLTPEELEDMGISRRKVFKQGTSYIYIVDIDA